MNHPLFSGHRKQQWWAAVGQAAGEVGTAWLNSDAQRAANKTNIKLQKQDEEWQTSMSNTAVQRRADDIEKAGGNRALAFTNGQEASTPSLSPAHVEAPHYDAPHIGTAILQAQMLQAQKDNLNSQTFKNSAETQSTAIDNQFKQAVLEGKIKYTNLGTAQDYETKMAQTAQIKAQIENLASQTDANKIANWVSDNTREDAIRKIKSDAILAELHIDPQQFKADWERIKDTLLRRLEQGGEALRKDLDNISRKPK